MTYEKERERFIGEAEAAGLAPETALALLRYSTTLQRLAEAQCNGDYPADNGDGSANYCGAVRALKGGYLCACGQAVAKHDPKCSRCGVDWPLSRVGCGSMWKASALRGKDRKCPDCRTQALVVAALKGSPWQAYFQGDPRGAVLQLFPAGTAHDDMYCGRVRGIYVPARARGN